MSTKPHMTSSSLTSSRAWREIEKRNFAVLSHATPAGRPRASGVMYGVTNRRLFVVTAPTSWKARHIGQGTEVALTIPVRRGGILSLIAPIPPATISLHATVTVHPPGQPPVNTLPPKLVSGLPPGRRDTATVLELHPVGDFLAYGIGVPLMAMRDPDRSLARVPVGRPPTAQVGATP